jgi:hypothetical protein
VNLSHYKLDSKPLKLLSGLDLLKTDRCVVKVEKDTLALPILIDDRTAGSLFHGSGQFIIDTIIETKKGAIGKSTNKDLTQPFIMLGKAPTMENKFSTVDSPDLERLGYSNAEMFVKAANDYCSRFMKGKMHCGDLEAENDYIFAFPDAECFDILVSKENKLIYTSKKRVFVSKEGKEVLTSPEHIVVSKGGKAVVIAHGDILVEK